MTAPIVFFFSSRRRHTRYWRDWSSDVCSSDLVQHRVRILTRLALDRNQAIAGLQSRPFGGPASQHALDQYPGGGAQAKGLSHFRSDLTCLDPDPTARDAAGLDNLFHDVFGARGGNRKAD